MPTIEIDPDVYELLRSQVRDFGDTPSKVIRRMWNLPEHQPGEVPLTESAAVSTPNSLTEVVPTRHGGDGPLASFVTDPRFQYARTATDKYLAILGFAHKQDPTGFREVVHLEGRRRKYFGRSEQEISSSGKTTHPRQIPGTEYWAMTNADTQQKREMLRKALSILRFSTDDIRIAEEAVS